jgi:hypothetical protein
MNESNNTPDNGVIGITDARDSTSSGDRKVVATHIMLHDGYCVSAPFYNTVLLQVEEIIPALERGVKYTLEMLCGEKFWDLLTDGENRMAGRCMANMVVHGQLPLRFAHSKHEYPKWYQLI